MKSSIRYIVYFLIIVICLSMAYIYFSRKDNQASLLGFEITGLNIAKNYMGTNSMEVKERNNELSVSGILSYTNIEREKNGVAPLTLSPQLSSSASVKVRDMISKQYFEHESPDGKTVGDLVFDAGYDFQNVGENIALGTFKDDQTLVNAWMNSPTHRKNMLDPKYTEIGVATMRGEYDGEMKWFAVQHFGNVAPICPEISLELKRLVETEKIAVEVEEIELKKMAKEIEVQATPEMLDTYNTRAKSYNARLNNLKIKLGEYNKEVDIYNTCIIS